MNQNSDKLLLVADGASPMGTQFAIEYAVSLWMGHEDFGRTIQLTAQDSQLARSFGPPMVFVARTKVIGRTVDR